MTHENVEMTSEHMKSARPSAFLFCNGNAVYFDEKGHQISELQLLGIKALSEYRKQFPTAPIMWAVWRKWAHEMSEECIKSLIEQLRHPYE